MTRRRLRAVGALLPRPVQTRLGWLLPPTRSGTVGARILVEQESRLGAGHPEYGRRPASHENRGIRVTRGRLAHPEHARLPLTRDDQAACRGTRPPLPCDRPSRPAALPGRARGGPGC